MTAEPHLVDAKPKAETSVYADISWHFGTEAFEASA